MNKLPQDDATVIGAGIIGVCCALNLAERGLNVTLIDPEPPCSLTSHGNAGVISPWSCVPQSIPGLWKSLPKWVLDPKGPVSIRKKYLLKFLPWAIKFLKAGNLSKLDYISNAMLAISNNSVENYRELLKGTGCDGLIKDAYYVHVYRNKSSASLSQLSWQLREKRQVPIELVDANELQKLEPNLSKTFKAAVLIKGQGRATDPSLVGRAIFNKAMSLKVNVINSKVHFFKPNPGNSFDIQLENSIHSTKNIVIAAGVWSSKLLEPFKIKIPLESERGYHLVCKNPGIKINHSIMDADRKCVASLMDNGVRIAGTAEFAGLNAPPDYKRAKIFKSIIKEIFPKINTFNTVEWMGSRPSFPDSLPCLGEIPSLPGVFAAFGHSHYGLSMAPNTGKIIADCVTNKKTDISLEPYRIDRFK